VSAEENAALLRRYLEALAEGDMDTVRAAFAEDAVWHLPGKSPLAGDYEGPDAILGFIGRSSEMTGGTFRLELLDVMASEEHGVQWQRITAERNGKSLDEVEAIVCRMREGKIAEAWHRPEQYSLDEFFS
jgi:ketosteroid isomerase-like protein